MGILYLVVAVLAVLPFIGFWLFVRHYQKQEWVQERLREDQQLFVEKAGWPVKYCDSPVESCESRPLAEVILLTPRKPK